MTRRGSARTGVLLCAAWLLVLAGALSAAAYQRPGRTERVSVASGGAQVNGTSTYPAISADGRFVAFQSNAANLVPGDTNNDYDVFVHDRETGATGRVSVSSEGAQGTRPALGPAISADGRHVTFSTQSALVPGDTNNATDVFVRDRETGAIERVSVGTGGVQANNHAIGGALSADGRYVAFQSQATNLVPAVTNDMWDVFVHDRETGVTQRVSLGPGGTESNGDSHGPAPSADGRLVTFHSEASNLVPGPVSDPRPCDLNDRPPPVPCDRHVYVHDRETGATERVSVGPGGVEGNGLSGQAAISADGRFVAFQSEASNLVPGDTNGRLDAFVHDRETGATERVSVATGGAQSDGGATGPAITPDGRFVAFQSTASNLAPGDTNGAQDVFVHDRDTGVTERVSVSSAGAEGNAHSFNAAIGADGRHVAFDSLASTLVPDDTASWDAFVRDRGPSTGVGGLAASAAGGEVIVEGWATFSGAIVTSAVDPGDDGVDPLGAEILRASVTYRPEEEDVLLRTHPRSLPHAGARHCSSIVLVCAGTTTGAGAPGILYRWNLAAGDTPFEVRARRTASTTGSETGGAHFGLYRCDVVCTEVAELSGGIGVAGPEVRVSVPLEALGVGEGDAFAHVVASVAPGEAALAPAAPLDEVALPDAVIPLARVALGVAPADTPPEEVPYTAEADLVEGRFAGTVEDSGLGTGEHRVWARACLGQVCGSASALLAGGDGSREP